MVPGVALATSASAAHRLLPIAPFPCPITGGGQVASHTPPQIPKGNLMGIAHNIAPLGRHLLANVRRRVVTPPYARSLINTNLLYFIHYTETEVHGCEG